MKTIELTTEQLSVLKYVLHTAVTEPEYNIKSDVFYTSQACLLPDELTQLRILFWNIQDK